MSKRKLIVIGIGVCVLLIGAFVVKNLYIKKIQESSFLLWSKNISASNLEEATLSSGYGTEEIRYELTIEDKVQLAIILNSLTVDDVLITQEGKESLSDLNLYVKGNGNVYVFQYSLEQPQKVYVLMETLEEVKKSEFIIWKNYWVENEEFISFIASRNPKN